MGDGTSLIGEYTFPDRQQKIGTDVRTDLATPSDGKARTYPRPKYPRFWAGSRVCSRRMCMVFSFLGMTGKQGRRRFILIQLWTGRHSTTKSFCGRPPESSDTSSRALHILTDIVTGMLAHTSRDTRCPCSSDTSTHRQRHTTTSRTRFP